MAVQSRVLPPNDAQLRIILRKFDVNEDVLLNKEELEEVLQHLGRRSPHRNGFIFDEKVNDLVKYIKKLLCLKRHADSNADGCISAGEMNDLVKYIKKLDYTLK